MQSVVPHGAMSTHKDRHEKLEFVMLKDAVEEGNTV